MEEIIISKENTEIFEYFTNRPKKLKFDVKDGIWYKLTWTEEALQKRKELYIIKRKERYRQLHPKKENSLDNTTSDKLTQYLKNKLGLVKKRNSRSECIPDGKSFPTEVHYVNALPSEVQEETNCSLILSN
jgi:hypothetical protein